MEKRVNFLGTYFSKDTVLRLTSIAKILSWVVVGVYSLEWLVQALAMVTTALVFADLSGSNPAARSSTRERFQ